jgi:hypothetical protein
MLQRLLLLLLQNTESEKINRSRILSLRFYTLKHLQVAHVAAQEVVYFAAQEVTYVAAQEVTCCGKEVTCCGERSDIFCCSRSDICCGERSDMLWRKK